MIIKNIPAAIITFFILIGVSPAQLVKFEEAFDSLGLEERGWLLINNDSSMADYPMFTEGFTFTNTGPLEPQAGRYFIHFDALNANDQGVIDQWIVTPLIKDIGKFDVMTFWCGAVDNKYKDSLSVLVSIAGNSIGDFTEIDRFKVSGPSGTWHKMEYDLAQYAGSDIYFAVRYIMLDAGVLGANSDNVWIDHFRVAEAFGPDVAVSSYELYQNYPNPFNPETGIVFSIPEASNVSIRIYDLAGREITLLMNDELPHGRFNLNWNAEGKASGVYFCTMNAVAVSGGAEFSKTIRMVLVK